MVLADDKAGLALSSFFVVKDPKAFAREEGVDEP